MCCLAKRLDGQSFGCTQLAGLGNVSYVKWFCQLVGLSVGRSVSRSVYQTFDRSFTSVMFYTESLDHVYHLVVLWVGRSTSDSQLITGLFVTLSLA
jgi:hypothetical protein